LKLTDIPGIGARIRDRLIVQFGSEDAAWDAIRMGNVADLLHVLSERQAISLVQWIGKTKYGAGSDDFLATDEAARVYRLLIERMASYAHTEYARLKIGTLFPSSSLEMIRENQERTKASIGFAMRLENKSLGDLLSKIKPLKESPALRVRERAILAASPDVLVLLKSRELDKLIDIHLAETDREMVDAATGYSHVCAIGYGRDCPADIETAQSTNDWYLVPEAILGYYKYNLDILLSATKAAKELQDAGICIFEGLNDILMIVQKLGTDDDAESLRLSSVLKNIDNRINEAASWANAELKRKIQSSSITLAGVDVLQALGKGEGFRDLFEVQMSGIFRTVLNDARTRAASALGLSGADAAQLDNIFCSEIQYPMELDLQALHRFEQDLRSRLENRSIRFKRELARELADKKDAVQDMVSTLREFDFSYAIGTFALREGLSMPEILAQPALGFQDGRNLFLNQAEPVSYSLGQTGLSKFEQRTALLSGVNSGGKTSLLDLLAQITILAHMGMPVPARECRLSIIQELYYFSKSRGTLSAGAFETAMRKFAMVENASNKLVLADELESITEPGASAKIIACMLDELSRLGSMAVFVSHLAEEIEKLAETPVRVDGIEASGLDSENNLIVRRTPRYNYLARSTPELILDRLVRTTTGAEHEFYSRLLSKFK
jgi:DNA mismatch repair protein MutS2